MARKNQSNEAEARAAVIPPVPTPLLEAHATFPTPEAIEAAFVAHYRASLVREAEERARPARPVGPDGTRSRGASARAVDPSHAALLAAVDSLKAPSSGLENPGADTSSDLGASGAAVSEGLSSAWDLAPEEAVASGSAGDATAADPFADPFGEAQAARHDAPPAPDLLDAAAVSLDALPGSDAAGGTAGADPEDDVVAAPVAHEALADPEVEASSDLAAPAPEEPAATSSPAVSEPKSRRGKGKRPR